MREGSGGRGKERKINLKRGVEWKKEDNYGDKRENELIQTRGKEEEEGEEEEGHGEETRGEKRDD